MLLQANSQKLWVTTSARACAYVCFGVSTMLIRPFSGVTCTLINMKIKHTHEITYLQNTTSHYFSVTPAYLEHNTHNKLQDFISQCILIYDRGIRTRFLLLSNYLKHLGGFILPLLCHIDYNFAHNPTVSIGIVPFCGSTVLLQQRLQLGVE